MNMKKIILYILGIAILFSGVGYFIWRDLSLGGQSNNESGTLSGKEEVATTTTKKSAEQVAGTSLNIPDFSKIVIDPSINEATKIKLTADLQEVITTLKGNVMNPAAWTQLGILRQNAKDYDGALEAWKFSNELSPQNAIPFLNIANLYGYYLHDNAQAEKYFKKAIAIEPKNGYVYFKTYEFYTDINEPSKARTVLEQGVAANPTDKQLQAALDSLSKTQ